MDKRVKILGIPGSLRRQSFNRYALEAAAELVPADASFTIADIDGIPPFNQDLEEDLPSAVRQFKEAISAADAILFATPEYNYSIPGVLKNAIDWASRPYGQSAWKGKVAAIMGASIGTLGTARAQYHLRQTFVFLDIIAVNQPEVMIGNASERFDSGGRLTDAKTRELVGQLMQKLVQLTQTVQGKS